MHETLQTYRFTLPRDIRYSQQFRHRLAREFGGYTVSDCEGGWVNPEGRLIEDENEMFEVAVPSARAGFLLGMAISEARRRVQQALYWVRPGGEAVIINLVTLDT